MFLSKTLHVWKLPTTPRCSAPASILSCSDPALVALNRLNLPYITFHLLHFQMCFRWINNTEYEINAHRQSWQLSSLPPPPYINVLHLFIHLFYALLLITDFCTKCVKNRSEKATAGKKKRNIQMLSSFFKPAYSVFKLCFQLKKKKAKILKQRIQNILTAFAKLVVEILA